MKPASSIASIRADKYELILMALQCRPALVDYTPLAGDFSLRITFEFLVRIVRGNWPSAFR
jgi:hypothetical protein